MGGGQTVPTYLPVVHGSSDSTILPFVFASHWQCDLHRFHHRFSSELVHSSHRLSRRFGRFRTPVRPTGSFHVDHRPSSIATASWDGRLRFANALAVPQQWQRSNLCDEPFLVSEMVLPIAVPNEERYAQRRRRKDTRSPLRGMVARTGGGRHRSSSLGPG